MKSVDDCPILDRIKQLGQASVYEMTRGLYFSDDGTIHDKLFWYRAIGLIRFSGDEIHSDTIVKLRTVRKGKQFQLC